MKVKRFHEILRGRGCSIYLETPITDSRRLDFFVHQAFLNNWTGADINEIREFCNLFDKGEAFFEV